jgi:hypothetical protein
MKGWNTKTKILGLNVIDPNIQGAIVPPLHDCGSYAVPESGYAHTIVVIRVVRECLGSGRGVRGVIPLVHQPLLFHDEMLLRAHDRPRAAQAAWRSPTFTPRRMGRRAIQYHVQAPDSTRQA